MIRFLTQHRWIPHAVRIILSLLMIYGAFTETGIWTALCLLFVFGGVEALNLSLNKLYAGIKANGSMVDDMLFAALGRTGR